MTKGERNKDISDRGRNNKEISTWEKNKRYYGTKMVKRQQRGELDIGGEI